MWEYHYNEDDDTTTLIWEGKEQATLAGEITRWKNGYPATDDAREAVSEAIQEAGTPERIRMLFDFNYEFQERDQY